MQNEKDNQTENPETTIQPTGTPANPASQPETNVAPVKNHRFSRKQILIIVTALVLLLGSSASAFFVYNNSHKKKPIPVSVVKPSPTVSSPVAKLAEVKQCSTKGGTALKASWLDNRLKLTGIKFIKPPKADEIDSEHPEKVKVDDYVVYYKIGLTDKKQNIILFQKFPDTEGELDGIAVEQTTGHYIVLLRSSNNLVNESGTKNIELLSNATFDSKQFFPELCVLSMNYKNVELKDSYKGFGTSGSYFDLEHGNNKQLEVYNNGTLYENIFKDDPQYTMSRFIFKRKDTLWQTLNPPSLLTHKDPNDSYSAPVITWNDGNVNTKISYNSAFRGCGGGGTQEYAKNLTTSDLTQLGKDKSGTVIYGFVSANNALFQIHYKEYLEQYTKSYFGESYKASLAKLSAANYLKLRPVIVLKDGLGRYEVLRDSQFYSGGGCGKPVIYLYPEQNMHVSLQVGANIVKSDPAYNDGWNVTAYPNGTITNKGKNYGSLYWEGYGYGDYPIINSGVVVPHDQVEVTLRNNLNQQGLNDREISDFVAFWLPKMSTKPYVRISWLGNVSLNRLAPLNINPAPDTIIRVFLDAEGLDSPVALKPQQFIAPERKGFTVVEWGGLLNGRLQ